VWLRIESPLCEAYGLMTMSYAASARNTFWDLDEASLETRAFATSRGRALSESWVSELSVNAQWEEVRGEFASPTLDALHDKDLRCSDSSDESDTTAPHSLCWSDEAESDTSSTVGSASWDIAGPPGAWMASGAQQCRPQDGKHRTQKPNRRKVCKTKFSEEEEVLTTLLLRNLPPSSTRDDVCTLLASCGFAGQYDFMYVPTNFKTMSVFGYAFVNFVNATTAESAREKLQGCHLPGVDEPTLEALWSRPHQGREMYIERYRNCPVMHPAVPDKYKPLLYKDGLRVSFPAATKVVSAPKDFQQAA